MANGEAWKWRSDLNGAFSIKQVRLDLELASVESDNNDFIFGWNSWPPPKVNYLLWRALIGKIASRVGLVRRGIPLLDCSCPRCGMNAEDPDYIFFNCIWSRSVWWNMLIWMRINFPVEISNIKDLFGFIQNRPGSSKWKRVVYTVALATVWWIWKARNEMVFERRFIPVGIIVEQVKEDAYLWISNRSKLIQASRENWRMFNISVML
ncbi:uncharacterized protein LOC110882973 [Helianthus annuus]|uniref:uncharacterized protein LOC110882973 n=1 Tax=Helianthus annuus TaxID=4232 RepID=UPI000B90508D|nr:uncharacterized protein LOC110882973 [Helianthus annuus]